MKYIKELNQNKKSSNKNFYIIIKKTTSNNLQTVTIQNLQEEFYKIKELLARCGNIVSEFTKEKQIRDILFSFLNSRLFLND